MSREIHIPSAVYVTRFLNSVGEWIKSVYESEKLQDTILKYNVHSTTFQDQQFHSLYLQLMKRSSSDTNRNVEDEAEIGSITIEYNIRDEISEANLKDARFSYIRTDFEWVNPQQPHHAFWEDLRNLAIQYDTPILHGVATSQWPEHVGTPFIEGNYLTECVDKYLIIYSNQNLHGDSAKQFKRGGGAGAWLSMERLIDLLDRN